MQLDGKVVPVLKHVMKTYGGVALVGGEWSASRSCRFTPGERALSTHCIGGWLGPRFSLDDVEKRKFLILPGLELPTPRSSSP
jgi:hypothetical protein